MRLAVLIWLGIAVSCFGQPIYWPVMGDNSWFVDSVAGNDANSGRSPSAPYQTVTTLLTNNLIGANIYLKRGSIFRESFRIPTNSFVQPYGIVNYKPFGTFDGKIDNRPIISGAVVLTNAQFTLQSGSVYKYPITPPVWSATNANGIITASNVCMVWANDLRLGATPMDGGATSIVSCAAITPSWFYDNTNNILYIHKADGTTPVGDGVTYEASLRALCLYGGDGYTLFDLQSEKGYNDKNNLNDNAFDGEAGGISISCIFRQGYNHVAGVANNVDTRNNLVFNSCLIGDSDYLKINVAPTTFVAFKSSVTAPFPTVYLTNCGVYQITNNSFVIGYFAHHSGVGNFVNCFSSNCYVMNTRYGASCAFPSEDLESPMGFTAINCSLAINQSGKSQLFTDVKTYGCTNALQGVPTNVSNCKLYDVVSTGLITTTNTGVTNTIFHGAQMAFAIETDAGFLKSASNTYSGANGFYFSTTATSNSVAYSDFNDYFGIGSVFASGLPTNNSYAQWKVAFPTLDVHSVTTDPGITSPWYPSNYLMAVAADIPQMVVQPVNATVLLTNTFTVSALAQGFPTLLYQWQHAGTNLAGATQTSYSKVITNGDEGNYAVIVTNDLGSCTSSIAVLTITQPFIQYPTNLAGFPAISWWCVSSNYVTNAGVLSMADLNTNHFDLTNRSAANTMPARTAAGLNGLDYITINNDGGAPFHVSDLQSAIYTSSQPHEVVMVLSVSNVGVIGNTYVYNSKDSAHQNAVVEKIGIGFIPFAGNTFTASTVDVTNKWIVLDTVYNTTLTLFTNNVSGATGNGSQTCNGFTLGNRYDLAGPSSGYWGTFAECVTFGSVLSTTARSNLFVYFTNKYNLPP